MLALRNLNTTKKKYMIPDSLTQAAGTIYAVFGSTTYFVSLIGLVASTRYQLYLVPGGTLVYSTNENSTGPAGYTSWILVGCFLTNNLASPGFGAFVSIEGVPESDFFTLDTTIGNNFLRCEAGGNPSYGGTVFNINRCRRKGRELFWEWYYKQTSAGSAGGGDYTFKCPFTPDLLQYKNAASEAGLGHVGLTQFNEITSGTYKGVNTMYFYAPNTDRIGGYVTGHNAGASGLGGAWGASFNHLGVATILWGMRVNYMVSGWSNTPIKDL